MAEVGESVNMTSELGVSFHPDNYAKKQNIDGKTEQLIELVREHPHLYYPRLPEHRGAQLNHNTWDSTAEVLAVEKLCGRPLSMSHHIGPTRLVQPIIMRFSGHT